MERHTFKWVAPWDGSVAGMRKAPHINHCAGGAWCVFGPEGACLRVFLHGMPWPPEWYARRCARKFAKRLDRLARRGELA